MQPDWFIADSGRPSDFNLERHTRAHALHRAKRNQSLSAAAVLPLSTMLIKTGYLHIKFQLLKPLEDRPGAWLHHSGHVWASGEFARKQVFGANYAKERQVGVAHSLCLKVTHTNLHLFSVSGCMCRTSSCERVSLETRCAYLGKELS